MTIELFSSLLFDWQIRLSKILSSPLDGYPVHISKLEESGDTGPNVNRNTYILDTNG